MDPFLFASPAVAYQTKVTVSSLNLTIRDRLMNYPKLFAIAIVSVCMFVPTNFVNAKSPKGKQSHKRSHHVDHNRKGNHDKHHKEHHVRHHKERHDGHHDKHRVDGHDKFHDKSGRRHEKFHDKHRERSDHDADDHDGHHDKHHVNRHEKFHDKKERRHEDFHDNHHDADDHHRDDHRRDRDRWRTREDEGSWETQRLNEERKLQHRLGQADHLRQISERNGNPRSGETADRKEQRAFEHHDKRLQRIDQHEPVGPTRSGFAEQDPSSIRQPDQLRTSSTVQPPSRSSSEFSDGFQRRLFSEQRELRQRLDIADRLRQLGEDTGDQQLLETASRIEDAAFERFDRRTQRLGEPLTPARQSVVREPNRMVSQGINDIENAILEQPSRRLWQEVRRFFNR